MEAITPKKNTTLSMDRAAFLLLRVKKAFKRKRNLRKEKATPTTGAQMASQGQLCRKVQAPLLRSRTLPAIVVPGLPLMTMHSENSYVCFDESIETKSAGCRKGANAAITRKSLAMPTDDSALVYRRKSAGTPNFGTKQTGLSSGFQFQQEKFNGSVLNAGDALEGNFGGSVSLRIPVPHVIAARAYRLPAVRQQSSSTTFKKSSYPPNEPTSSTSNTGSTPTTALTRLVQLLHQTSCSKAPPSNYSAPDQVLSASDETSRRLSWERRKDSTVLQRSTSIDSVAGGVWNVSPRPSLDLPPPIATPFNKRPSTSSLLSNCSASSHNAQLNINCSEVGSSSSAGSSRRESLLSPSSIRRNKLTRMVNDNVVANNCSPANTLTSGCESHDPNNDEAVQLQSPLCHHDSPDHLQYLKKNARTTSCDHYSEQLMNPSSVTTRKPLRSATSHSPEDMREMEYLIPHAAVSALAPTSTTSSTILSVSRQSRANRSSKMSHPKNARLNTKAQDAAYCDENTNTLSVSRLPTSDTGRVKGGNTPHRNKLSKKQLKLAQGQLDNVAEVNVHLHALFSAVELGHLDKARTILESTDVDVNSINSDGLSVLDVAVLSNNRSMTKMLLQFGALEGFQHSTDSIGTKLNALLKDAESRIHDLCGASDGASQPTLAARPSISSIIIGNSSSSVTGCAGSETDKQIGIWERRVKALRRVLLGWDQARPPDTPSSVAIHVTGENSIAVQLQEPLDGAIGTKFKVQWSTRSDFSNIVGERQVTEWISCQGTMGSKCHIIGLTQGRRYFVRAMCGNVKGWGPCRMSVPASVVPSSWRDVHNDGDRYLGRQHLLDELFTAVRLARPADVSEMALDSSSVHRRNPKKKTTIKQLFSVASKFQKNLRRGIYLASTIYCEDKVLVTNEDFLPVIEIDEAYPSTLHNDFHWLMKVSCSWEDVKSLRSDMERNLTSAVHFRTKLLSAVCHMQSALGLTDLGTLYYKPFRDSHGTVVFTCVQAVRSQKAVSILNSRWLPIKKLQKKVVAVHEDSNISEKLILSIGDHVHYHQASVQRLEPGLYLGYLKMQCSVEQIQVVVPVKMPNVLPHCRIREHSHISAEEWLALKRNRKTAADPSAQTQLLALDFGTSSADSMTKGQRLFLSDLAAAARNLLAHMNIRNEYALTHRLYDVEVIEHSKDVSFLVICPSVELTCAAPGQPEVLLQNDDLVSLSIQAFEMIHLRTYQPGILQKYSRLSCVLELDTALANHSLREAFSTSELQTAKERLAKLQELTANLNSVWKSARWLMDVIAFARDKNAQPSLLMREILEFAAIPEDLHHSEPSHLLQLPCRNMKCSKGDSGRGSWPGLAESAQVVSLAVEHSKSDQDLGRSQKSQIAVKFTEGTTDPVQLQQGTKFMQMRENSAESTKNSVDSITSDYTAHSSYSATELETYHAIASSQSADMLTLSSSGTRKVYLSGHVHSKLSNTNTVVAFTHPPPSISISHSVPHLSGRSKTSQLSTLSSKVSSSPDFEGTKGALHIKEDCDIPSFSAGGAVAGVNLQDGGLYLRSTLSALQTEMKVSHKADESHALTRTPSKSLVQQNSEGDSAGGSSVAFEQTSGIIQVYTAYNTGLASGTSLKLHVTPKTSAREVINLVVKQLNMAAVLKGNNGPIYTSDMLDSFCLVAVIGARERCLRDDFKPLQLQNPWKKGRLYVRQKHELLAAIEHSSRKSSQLI